RRAVSGDGYFSARPLNKLLFSIIMGMNREKRADAQADGAARFQSYRSLYGLQSNQARQDSGVG
ncbi:MAG: hypothetical protein J1E32_05670, partial [Treponema sp.]|nr:hypothetical protein [Treponema sp.]